MYNIIIVDDEPQESELLKKIIEKMNTGFDVSATFANAYGALEYIKYNIVNIIITDIRMPDMSGLEFVQKVKSFNSNMHVIIITGYPSFKYAQEAIKYKIDCFLEKPIDYSVLLNELCTIKKEIDKNLTPGDCFEFFFCDLFTNNIKTKNELIKRAENLHICYDKPGYIMSVTIDVKRNIEDYISEQLPNVIKNILMYIIGNNFYCFYTKNNMYIFAVFGDITDEKTSLMENEIFSVLNCKSDIEILKKFSVLSEAGSDIFDDELKLEIFVSKVLVSESDNVSSKIINFLRNSINTDENEDYIKLLSDKGTKNIYAYLSTLEGIGSEKDYNSENLINMIVTYIDDHYSDNITRSDMANKFFMNPSYFSRYFKQKKGINFYEYLTHIRVEKSKKMLESGNSINKVSELCGFGNSKNFRRLFKMQTGITPLEYKNLHRN